MRQKPSRDMDRADTIVQQNPMFRGKASLPSRYLERDELAVHEKRTAEALAKAFGKGVPPEVVTFAAAPPLAADAKPSDKVGTLIVSYRMEPSGAAYASKKPRGIFVGIVFFFDVDLSLPGDKEPLHAEHTFAEAIPVDILRKPADPDALEALVYQEMLREAFAELQKRYLGDWFGQ
jgi:hypothetical protein